jgi:hypothetical protein
MARVAGLPESQGSLGYPHELPFGPPRARTWAGSRASFAFPIWLRARFARSGYHARLLLQRCGVCRHRVATGAPDAN